MYAFLTVIGLFGVMALFDHLDNRVKQKNSERKIENGQSN